MDPVTIGGLGIGVLILIFLLGMPVGFTMAGGRGGIRRPQGFDTGLSSLARDFWRTFSSYNLTVIPMFVFMGSVKKLAYAGV